MKNTIFTLLMIFCMSSLFAQAGLHISNGATLQLNGDVYLVLNTADLENNGTLTGTGTSTVVFSGNSVSGLYGSSASTLYNLKISKGNNTGAVLYSDVTVSNDLDITEGQLNLNGHVIDLEGQIINEDEINYITGVGGGYIEVITSLDNPNQANPGNLGVEITSTANLGSTILRRGHVQQTAAGGGFGIFRYIDIIPTNNSNLDATLHLYYHDAELASLPESELELWRSEDSGSTWTLIGVSDIDNTANYVEQWGIDAFSRWTLGSATTDPLPVELHSFAGMAEDGYNLLEWTTLTEENVDGFVIEKLDRNNWIGIGQVEAAHFSGEAKHYQFRDRNYNTADYYRLRIEDYDAKKVFSKIVFIKRTDVETPVFTVFPNPTESQLNLVLSGTTAVRSVRLINTSGKELFFLNSWKEQMDLSSLPAGMYYLEVQTGEDLYVEKITKQ